MLVVTEDWYLWSHRRSLAAAARDAGYDVTILTRVAEHGERIRSLGLNVVHFDFSRGSLSPRRNLLALHRICTVYRRWKPHLVHHVAIKPIVLGSVAAARTRTPAVINSMAGLGTALTSDHMKARLARPVLRPALGWAMRQPRSHTIVQNPENARFLESLGVRQDRISLVRGAGVDVFTFRQEPEPPGPIRVTMVSRLLRQKGVREFVEAAALVRERRDDVVFTLVGKPDEENPTSVPAKQAQSWAADGLIEWWGHREDVAQVLASSHVAVLPVHGDAEGVPKVLLEAAACGRPVVATDVPGCREVVRHGGNGLLVAARNSRALADSIMTLVEDSARRIAMGSEGRRRAEVEFADSRINSETLAIYEGALARAGT